MIFSASISLFRCCGISSRASKQQAYRICTLASLVDIRSWDDVFSFCNNSRGMTKDTFETKLGHDNRHRKERNSCALANGPMTSKWIIGQSSDDVESAMFYAVHRRPPRVVAIYLATSGCSSADAIFQLQRVFPWGDVSMSDIEADALCQKPLRTLLLTSFGFPATNPVTHTGAICPKWIVGNDPYDAGDETCPAYVVHTELPQFVAEIQPAEPVALAGCSTIEPSSDIADSWVQPALDAYRMFDAERRAWRNLQDEMESSVRLSKELQSGKAIAVLRSQLQLSQEELAASTSICVDRIARLERGTEFTDGVAKVLAKIELRTQGFLRMRGVLTRLTGEDLTEEETSQSISDLIGHLGITPTMLAKDLETNERSISETEFDPLSGSRDLIVSELECRVNVIANNVRLQRCENLLNALRPRFNDFLPLLGEQS